MNDDKPKLTLSVEATMLGQELSSTSWNQGPGFAIKVLIFKGKPYPIFAPDWMQDNKEELTDFVHRQIEAVIKRTVSIRMANDNVEGPYSFWPKSF